MIGKSCPLGVPVYSLVPISMAAGDCHLTNMLVGCFEVDDSIMT